MTERTTPADRAALMECIADVVRPYVYQTLTDEVATAALAAISDAGYVVLAPGEVDRVMQLVKVTVLRATGNYHDNPDTTDDPRYLNMSWEVDQVRAALTGPLPTGAG